MTELLRSNAFYKQAKCVGASSHQNSDFERLRQRCINKRGTLFGVEYFPFYTASYLMQKPLLWDDMLLVTLFRDPLQRIFSDLLYKGSWSCRNIHYSKLNETSTEDLEAGLIACAKDPMLSAKYISNVYSKVFSGVWPYANPNKKLRENGVYFNPNMTIDRVHFEVAVSILKEFDVVLILEMFEETKLQLKCNGLLNDTLPHRNAGKHKQKSALKLDDFPVLKRELIAMNTYDIALYEFAKQIALNNVAKCAQNKSISNAITATNITKSVHVVPKVNWTFVYFQDIGYLMNDDEVFGNEELYEAMEGGLLRTNESYVRLREYVREGKVEIVKMKYFPFLVMPYMKFKREQWNDILLSALFMDPIQRVFLDLISPASSLWQCSNVNYENELVEDELIECTRDNADRYTSNVYTKILSGIWPYSNAHSIERVHYDVAASILKDFDIIIILEMLDETNVQWKCFGDDAFEKYRILDNGIKQNIGYNLNDFPELKHELIALNKYDIDLYNMAMQIALKKSLESR